MATKVIGMDYRRMDDKRTLWTPYWLTSLEIDGADLSDANVGLLWSFPAEKYGTRLVIINQICIQVTTVFAGGSPTLDIGSYTLATDAVTTAGTATVVTADEYIPNADITATSAGIYWAATGNWLTAKAAAVIGSPLLVTPADTTVPCVCILGAASMASGKARVLMQVIEVPLF
jgi:hypothetical protein